MKIKFIPLIFIIALSTLLHAQSYDKRWSKIEKAEKNNLPQTVVSLADGIFTKAVSEKNSPQMLKAYLWKMKYQQLHVPDSFYTCLGNLERWSEEIEKPVDKAILHSLLAQIYADYAANNAWKLRRRSNLDNGDSLKDIREWSGNLLVDKVLQETQKALLDSLLLLNTSSKVYVPFIEQADGSIYYHHDMYHLLVARGISALSSVSSLGNDIHIKNQISILYRNMIHSYKEKQNENAVLLASLDSLKWRRGIGDIPFLQSPVTEVAFESNSFIVSLDSIIEIAKKRELCAEFYLLKAEQAKNEQLNALALKLCDTAISLYPSYKRINALKNLRAQILQPTLDVNMFQIVYPCSELQMNIFHSNLKGFTVELYKVNLATDSPKLAQRNKDKNFYSTYCKKINSQHFALSLASDYVKRDTTLKFTSPTEGLYLLKMIPDAKARITEDRLLYASKFEILSRKLPSGKSEFIALDSKTGHPIANALLRLYANEKGVKVEKDTFNMNSEGRVEVSWQKKYRYFKIETKGDKAMPMRSIYGNSYFYNAHQSSQEEIKLLTDRTIYRPGQTVYVKGIVYDLSSDTANVLPGEDYTVILANASGEKIHEKKVHTNDFGSFTTEIVLPLSCLNGTYTIKTENSWLNIQVEEYKRPTFSITFESQDKSYQLGDSLQVLGKAQTYAGVPLQEGMVKYVVTRSSGFWQNIILRPSVTLVSGETKIDKEGTFIVPFLLEKEEDDDDDEEEQLYTYTLDVFVTNSVGETQKASTSFAVGDYSLILTTDLSEKICKDDVIESIFEARNLNNKLLSIAGKYKLYPYTDRKGLNIAQLPVSAGSFVSNKKTDLSAWKRLPSGVYKLILTASDDQGKEVTSEQDITLFSLLDSHPATDASIWYYAENTSFDHKNPAVFMFGTSEKDVYVMMDVFCGSKRMPSSTILNLTDSVKRFEIPYKTEYGDGLKIIFAFVKNGRLYQQDVSLTKTIPDKVLKTKWEVFRDRLQPGEKEEWKLTLKTPDGKPAIAEMLATMYDASLDKIRKNNQSLKITYSRHLPIVYWQKHYFNDNYYHLDFINKWYDVPSFSYDSFVNPSLDVDKPEILVRGFSTLKKENGLGEVFMMTVGSEQKSAEENDLAGNGLLPQELALRTNFAETAFFYPQLHSNDKGEISFVFTMPESLTTWNFRGYAHTKGMLTAMLEKEVVASKEFMLTPNLPRFVRVGDKASIAASITNFTQSAVSGKVSLILFDPITEKVIATQKQKFFVDTAKVAKVQFSFVVPDKYEVLGCRMIANGGSFSDGEQHILPVLSNKQVVTEAVALPVRGDKPYNFSIKSLFNYQSKSATDKRLTFEFTSNPAWYAVQALPSLTMPTNENAISWASTYYANSLASYIMNAQPKIKAVFDSWKLQGGDKDAFLSNLQKNEEVKNILLEESPWLLEAKNEAEQKQRIALLFDLNNIQNSNTVALAKLKELQLHNGSWSWYKGMNASRYITQFVVETLARLTLLTNKPLDGEALRMQREAFDFLHSEALTEYNSILRSKNSASEKYVLSNSALEYLYLIALSGEKVPNKYKAACTYFLNKVGTLLSSSDLLIKAHAAIALHHFGHFTEAKAFMASIKEYAVQDEEHGMYFAFNEESSYAGSATKIAAHVAAMEAFDLVSRDTLSVENMKLWLLKQKQTQQWNSPIATVNAVYALLYRSSDLLTNDAGATIYLGDRMIASPSEDQGVGYIKKVITDASLIEKLPDIKITNLGKGIAWGSVYAQYREDLDKVREHGKELLVEKQLYLKQVINHQAQLHLLSPREALSVGDKVVVRLTIRLDRAMNFVQLKDQRPSCFEPLNSISKYHWSSGLGYYTSIKDASTNFFFDSLKKGVYVLECEYIVDRAGVYESGLATIQSAYAPEYVSHSLSTKIEVKN